MTKKNDTILMVALAQTFNGDTEGLGITKHRVKTLRGLRKLLVQRAPLPWLGWGVRLATDTEAAARGCASRAVVLAWIANQIGNGAHDGDARRWLTEHHAHDVD